MMKLARLLLALSTLPLASSTVAQPAGETAVLAGGCFWGMEAVFEHVKGVRSVVSGYAGGTAGDANYDKVSSERTAHAEAIKISFDPSQVSYAQLLRIYFAVAHDPTQVNRQGPDVGPSYRSAIFPQNDAQRRSRPRSSHSCAPGSTPLPRASRAGRSSPPKPTIRISCARTRCTRTSWFTTGRNWRN